MSVGFLRPGNGNQRTNKAKALAYVASRLAGLSIIDRNTVRLEPHGLCHFGAYTQPDGAMIGSEGSEQFGASAWHDRDRLLLFRDLGDGRCILYAAPIEQLFSRINIGRRGVRWLEVEAVGEVLARFDTGAEADLLEIAWTNDDARNWRDLIPRRLWTEAAAGDVVEHAVRGEKGQRLRAVCTVQPRTDGVDLVYDAAKPVNAAWGCYGGTTRIVVEGGRPARVLWSSGGPFGDLSPVLVYAFETGEPPDGAARAMAIDLERIDANPNYDPTTRRIMTDARLGQGEFRRALDDDWDHRCALTDLRTRAVLRASHIKAWRDSDDKERLDRNNGLLLAAHVDAMFDRNLIAFEGDGRLLWSPKVPLQERAALGLPDRLRKTPSAKMAKFLKHHRERLAGG